MQTPRPVVIDVRSIAKKYQLGVINRRMLVDQIESWVSRKFGRRDPHAQVHEEDADRMPTPYDFWALKDVSFQIRQGDVVGIMGRNGSGKSTLLKLLSRITAPTEGEIKIHGRVASLLEVGTGFNYELTGRENVYLNGSILGLKRGEIDDRYDSIVRFSEIEKFMDTPVKRYSSGMRVRLAFAVAAHLDPEILILDEVLAVGDAKFQEKCMAKIEETKNSGVTVLFVSHSAQSILQLCTRGIVLNAGRLMADNTAVGATEQYMNSLNLDHYAPEGSDGHNSRPGQFAGMIAQILATRFDGGRLALDCPIETPDGVLVADLAWVSQTRLGALRTEPTWNAAPDICVQMVDATKSQPECLAATHQFFKVGARECWIVWPDGNIERHRGSHPDFLDIDMPGRLQLT